MAILRIPCVLMRGGTSRGPYFKAADLPADRDEIASVLIAAMGAGHELQITGLGGGHPLTSKVAIVGPSQSSDADVDYLFGQVMVHERRVDFGPNCGNMLAGVGPFAIDKGLVRACDDVTTVRIRNLNTGKLIEARVQTPNGVVQYDGDAMIDGVPGAGSPVHLAFMDAAGSKTGSFMPTGATRDVIDGVEVSCIDAAMPVMLVRATDLGVSGHETASELNANARLRARLQPLRLEAGRRMGLQDVAQSVIPKPVLIAEPLNGGAISARYFMPHECHTALSVTGGVAIASAVVSPGTIAAEMAHAPRLPGDVRIEHPSGHMNIYAEPPRNGLPPVAMVVRTARPIMEGTLMLSMPPN